MCVCVCVRAYHVVYFEVITISRYHSFFDTRVPISLPPAPAPADNTALIIGVVVVIVIVILTIVVVLTIGIVLVCWKCKAMSQRETESMHHTHPQNVCTSPIAVLLIMLVDVMQQPYLHSFVVHSFKYLHIYMARPVTLLIIIHLHSVIYM